MPGTIRVSVLEAVDLPDVLLDGTTAKDVTAKVILGPRLFKTEPGVADGGKIAAWNSDFSFPVTNLRDKLVISICDNEDHSVTQTAIEVPSIIQKGSRDEFVALNKGGRIHLRMSFVLTEDEKKKIETMRIAAFKRKEESERLKKMVIVQPVTPGKELKKSPVSTVAITEVDISTTGDMKDSKESAHVSLGDGKDLTLLVDKKDSAVSGDKTDSTIIGDKKDATTLGDKKTPTPKRPAPKPMFNYAKAIGMPPSAKKIAKKPSAAVSDSSVTEVIADNCDVSSGEQTVRENAKDVEEAISSETTKLDASVEAPIRGDAAASLVTKAVESSPQGGRTPAGESGNVNYEVKANKYLISQSAESIAEEPLETKPADSVARSSPPPTEAEPGAPENLSNEVGDADKDGMASKPQAGRENVEYLEEVVSSRNSKLDSSTVDASPSSGHESTSLMASTDSASREHLQLSTRSSSVSITLKFVKARVKRTLSRVASRRSSSRVSRSDSLSRTPPPVPVIWVQECVKRALSNVKGCYGLNSSTVIY